MNKKVIEIWLQTGRIVRTHPFAAALFFVIINFLFRGIIYYNSTLFRFSDYTFYLDAVDMIGSGEKHYLLVGNFLNAISYIGFFAKYILGSIEWFFLINCLIGSLTGLVLFFLIIKITGSVRTGLLTLVILSFYTEYMVFSSVFYTPVIMIFLVSLILFSLYEYFSSTRPVKVLFYASSVILIFLITFFFKPELKFLPWIFLIAGIVYIKRDKGFSTKSISLFFLLITFYFLFQWSDLISKPQENVISNSFVFFGHTDYGGNGGEGAFIYPENKERYDRAFDIYCSRNGIKVPVFIDHNNFQKEEIKNFILKHPIKWMTLQGKKFFRTFGIVPESTSFKLLYTGLLKEELWLTSFVIVIPVALIVILFILFFSISSLKNMFSTNALLHQDFKTAKQHVEDPPAGGDETERNGVRRSQNPRSGNSKTAPFLYIFAGFFLYYIIASIFYGQYQERYRMPLIAIFIIPVLGYFIATFDRKKLFTKGSLIIKGGVIILFLVSWAFQIRDSISHKTRIFNTIESVKVTD